MMQQNRLFWIVAGVLMAAAIAAALIKAWPQLFPEILTEAPLDPDCDLRAGPCRTTLPNGGEVSFSIAPDSIPLVKPLKLNVELRGVEADAVEVDFRGVDMNMGYNRPSLSRQGDGRFTGQGMLPVCVRQAMEWEARVLLHTKDGLVAVPYRFITVKEGALTTP